MNIPPTLSFSKKVQSLVKHFKKHGHTLYPVGGVVRDILMGKHSQDVDFTTDAHYTQIEKICKKTIPTELNMEQ